jgi:hypothetical protein
LRQANKLGLLGLAIALVAAFGLISGLHGTSNVQAQAVGPKNCANPTGPGSLVGQFVPGATFVCTFQVNGLGAGGIQISGISAGFQLNGVTGAPCTGGGTFSATSVFTCTGGSGTILISESFTVTTVTGTTLFQTVLCTSTCGTSTAVTLQAFCGGTSTPVTWNGTCFGVTHQPTSEQKWCNNTTTVQNLQQVIGSNTLQLSTSGPGTSFTIPLFGGASTCYIQLYQNGVPCGLPTQAGTVICSDGMVVVSLTTPGSSAVISCAGGPLAQALPTAVSGVGPFQSPNGGACQSQTSGTSLQIPCGITAGTASPSGSSWTCDGVFFDIASMLSGCLAGQTNVFSCPLGSNAYTLTGGTATVSINFISTAGNGGVSGGINLGLNTFTFQAPSVGTLLVTATPQLIPSNGTLASVVTATFACGSGFSLTNTGFPLSSFFAGTTSQTNATFAINQPILGLTGQASVCGGGLPGTFTFATPGEVLFDNGRTDESVGCGLNGQQNIFGGSSLFNPNNLNPTLPLTFTCTGAAVLAIGGGAAGDAPINVTYASSVGGLTAVGSTLITVAPSGVPRISVACNPSTIAAGNTGSLCTATVTDQNGTPMTGTQGATVTWSVSDTTVAQILPCVVNTVGNINITTSPNVIPQIVPNTPCNPPSGSIPGQSVTWLNGQTTALLVPASYAHPEVVTVSATLGVLVPPEYACEVSPYTPVGYGTQPLSPFAGSAPVSGFLPGLTGCGAGNPIGYTGLASALSTAGSVALNGIITLPNATSASTTVSIGGPAGILIVGASTNSPLALLHGCNSIIVTTTAGTPIANIAALVSPSAAVVSIWAFNNGTKQFRAGFFSDPAAPVDFNLTGGTAATQQGSTTLAGTGGLAQVANSGVAAGTQVTEDYFVCVNQAAEIISG